MKKMASILIFALFILSMQSPSHASSNDWDVYNTENIHPLTNESGKRIIILDSMDYSPDGKTIVGIGTAGRDPIQNIPIFTIEIMNSDGTNRTILYANKSIHYDASPPRFSPDGNKIVFIQCYLNKETDIVETSLNILIKNGSKWDKTATIRKVFSSDEEHGWILFPSWSPDGRIIFEIDFAFYGENEGIWTIEPDGSNLTQILRTENGADYPSYSPDGSKILYEADGEHNGEIWIMNSDGTNRHRILDESWYPDEPRFTPDGRIIFSSARVSPHSDEISVPSIWMMNQDGSDKIMLVPGVFNNDVGCKMPVMSPDMHRLLFFHGLNPDYAGIYYIDDPTGEWKDSDGDGVYDGIDGAPNDPYAGYIGENPPLGMLANSIVPITVFLIIAVVAVLYILKKKGGKNENEKLP